MEADKPGPGVAVPMSAAEPDHSASLPISEIVKEKLRIAEGVETSGRNLHPFHQFADVRLLFISCLRSRLRAVAAAGRLRPHGQDRSNERQIKSSRTSLSGRAPASVGIRPPRP